MKYTIIKLVILLITLSVFSCKKETLYTTSLRVEVTNAESVDLTIKTNKGDFNLKQGSILLAPNVDEVYYFVNNANHLIKLDIYKGRTFSHKLYIRAYRTVKQTPFPKYTYTMH